ncbi:hypothetical protein EI555_004134, partial [Monodon monoceros]
SIFECPKAAYKEGTWLRPQKEAAALSRQVPTLLGHHLGSHSAVRHHGGPRGHPDCPTPLRSPPDQSVLFLTVGANTPTACCCFYISWQIPRKFMDDYYETSRQCSKPGVIFQTKRGQEVCADPNED